MFKTKKQKDFERRLPLLRALRAQFMAHSLAAKQVEFELTRQMAELGITGFDDVNISQPQVPTQKQPQPTNGQVEAK